MPEISRVIQELASEPRIITLTVMPSLRAAGTKLDEKLVLTVNCQLIFTLTCVTASQSQTGMKV
jgi:hypothetical protein